ncbi:MAG: phosphate ABC transporter substrate-binding protein PstS [Bacteroidota bacterium]|nr:phosphate ABC transporter substrate-binding protein PstS [Bacteroidota bacterium]
MKTANYLKGFSFLSLMIAIMVGSILNGCNGSGTGSNNNADSSAKSSGSDDALLGAGSTFVYPLFSKMFSEYNRSTGIRVNYQSIGSGGGILQMTNKTVDFGGSDAPLNEEQSKKIGVDILHIPMASGADVVCYNLPGLTDTLKLTPDVIAAIFLGKIKMWNDHAISNINPGVKLPDFPIIVVHRSDGSGTTYVWTDYLSKVSEEWKTKVGKGTAVNWPAGLGGKGNEGVTGTVKQTPGGIGYIELAYAVQNKMPAASIKNKSGNFIYPSLASITAAGNIQLPADAKVSITNTDAPDGYPISSFTWVIIYKEQNYNSRSQDKAQKLTKLLWWNIHEGQQYCKPLNYAPLSESALKVGENILQSATYNGKPILADLKQ